MAPREGRKKKQVTHEVVTREYTVNIHKRIHGMYVSFSRWNADISPNVALKFLAQLLVELLIRVTRHGDRVRFLGPNFYFEGSV